MSLNQIYELISRPEDEIKPDKKNYDIVIANTVIRITIENNEYDWKLYEVYFKDKEVFTNHYITGHSVIVTI
jgi:hypothetical protein